MTEEREVVALCTDCLSTIPEAKAEKDPFLQRGMFGVCPFCRGKVIVAYADQVDNLRRQRKDENKIF